MNGLYWKTGTYSVGDVFPMIPTDTNPNWSGFKFSLEAGDYIAIANIGGTNGRCYNVVDKADNKFLVIAPSSKTTTVENPYEYTADRPVWVIGSCATENIATINIHLVKRTSTREIREDIDKALGASAEAKETAEEALSNTAPISKMYNPPLRMDKPITINVGGTDYTTRSEFRVLDIGNSFSDDCTAYLSDLIDYMKTNHGIDDSKVLLARAKRGSGTYKNWYDIFHDQDTATYEITKVFGGLSDTFPGTAAVGNGEKFRRCLQEHEFDLIIIHQVSTYSGDCSGWEGNGVDGYLKELIRLVRFYQPQATIGFLMTHASPRQQQTGETTTREQWGRIVNATKWIAQNYGIDVVIPAGTAVENLRISKWGHVNQDPSAALVPHQLTRDGHHMGYGLCRYTGTCTYYETIFAPYFEKSVYNSGWVYQTITPPSGYEQDCIQITEYNAQAAQMCAMMAINDKYTLNNPDGLYIGPEEDVPTPPEPGPEPEPGTYTEIPLDHTNCDKGYYLCKLNGSSSWPSASSVTGSVIDCTYVGVKPNSTTQSFIALPEVPVGSKLTVASGYTIRVNYTNEDHTKFYRPGTAVDTTEETLIELIGLATNPELTKAIVHINKTGDASGALVTDAYVDTQGANWTLEKLN